MTTTMLIITAGSVGILLGFVLCALLSANGRDDHAAHPDSNRIDAIISEQFTLARESNDGYWGVLDNQQKMLGMSLDLREALDRAKAERELGVV